MKRQLDQKKLKANADYRKISNFDQLANFMATVIKKVGRISCEDFVSATGLSRRSAQRNLKELEMAGYLAGDENCPRGYFPTDKAKQIFGGAA
ncbi:TPA: hypothetical protein MW256_000197 [Acinetobacter baumannii]|uniref:hypothetical protein n=1 Tax=Acinetobacter baumannii TaxID=470 RepID=UPI00132FA5AC|nr:hypothetical protein [Acinetobacter baumannii]KAF0598749.1 hypothetical protein AB71190_03650 [Acinetobacter baumannii]HCA5258089.1 hypothetical protein [Acinetobacter baumannii]